MNISDSVRRQGTWKCQSYSHACSTTRNFITLILENSTNLARLRKHPQVADNWSLNLEGIAQFLERANADAWAGHIRNLRLLNEKIIEFACEIEGESLGLKSEIERIGWIGTLQIMIDLWEAESRNG
jgi:hypothetical protein